MDAILFLLGVLTGWFTLIVVSCILCAFDDESKR